MNNIGPMDKQEFLFLIPGIIYGTAIFDLLSISRAKKLYWESVLWVILLFFSVIVILFSLYENLDNIISSIFNYTIFLAAPILFAQSCYLLSSGDKKVDLKNLFISNRKKFFLAVSGLVLVNLILSYLGMNQTNPIFSFIGLTLFVLNVFFDKIYLRLLAAGFLVCWILSYYLK